MKFNFNINGAPVINEYHQNIGADEYKLDHDIFLPNNFHVSTGQDKTGQILIYGSDYTFSALNERIKKEYGRISYNRVKIVNPLYQLMGLYFHYLAVGDYAGVSGEATADDFMKKGNNLADVQSVKSARDNLEVFSQTEAKNGMVASYNYIKNSANQFGDNSWIAFNSAAEQVAMEIEYGYPSGSTLGGLYPTMSGYLNGYTVPTRLFDLSVYDKLVKINAYVPEDSPLCFSFFAFGIGNQKIKIKDQIIEIKDWKWKRYCVTFNTTTTPDQFIEILKDTTSGQFYLWGVQLNVGLFPIPYLQTFQNEIRTPTGNILLADFYETLKNEYATKEEVSAQIANHDDEYLDSFYTKGEIDSQITNHDSEPAKFINIF